MNETSSNKNMWLSYNVAYIIWNLFVINDIEDRYVIPHNSPAVNIIYLVIIIPHLQDILGEAFLPLT